MTASTSSATWTSSWTGGPGPVVAITGASKGIGRTLAIGLAGKGARVSLLSRDAARLGEVAGEIESSGGEALALPVDVTDADAVEAAFDSILRRFGSLDGAIANAGITEVGPAVEMDAAGFRRVVDTNLTGVFVTATAAGRRMLAQGSGSVVLVGSTFASSTIGDWAA